MPKSDQVVEYIGRYTHRVALSNHRIKKVENGKVTFSWFNYKTSKPEQTSLDAVEFLRLYLLHVLPKRFVKARHYGFLACRNKKQLLTQIREQLGGQEPEPLEGLTWEELFEKLYGHAPDRCSACKKGTLQLVDVIPASRDGPRSPKGAELLPH